MVGLISRGQRRGSERGVVLLGVGLKDAREEMFAIMVCDGLPLKLAFARAGFESKNNNAPFNLFHLPRIQERAAAILEARRTQGVVTLSEVTSMLQRVFAGAHSEGEYNAAHNAAFSLARLYGHVTDKSTLEVIRRPSRDPDAPAVQALGDWVAALPVISGPSPCLESLPSGATPSQGLGAIAAAPTGLGPLNLPPEPSGGPQAPFQGPPRGAPAPLLGPGPSPPTTDEGPGPATAGELRYGAGPEGSSPEGPELDAVLACALPEDPSPQSELPNEINWLAGPGPEMGWAGIGNGAPVTPVTGTPYERGGSEPLEQNGSPFSSKGTCPDGGSEPLETRGKSEAFPEIPPCQAPRLRPPGEKRVPFVPKRVPVKNREKLAKRDAKKRKLVPRIPSMKDLFG